MRLAFYTGPSQVHEIAEAMRAAGLNVTCEGTERVYIDWPVEKPAFDTLAHRANLKEELAQFDAFDRQINEARKAAVDQIEAHCGKRFGLA